MSAVLERALAAVDGEALARDVAALVRVPSLTGDEGPVLDVLAELAEARGLRADRHRHDLEALRRAPGYPGEEAPRAELHGLTVTVPAPDARRRLCLNGHVDVVGPGEAGWSRDPFSGAVAEGCVHGRGAVDMKGGVVAALHALAAVGAAGGARVETVLQAVPSEEDGGLGTFAALERDDRFDACLIPEPTELRVVCAQAGALTFTGTVHGVAAHAAVRLAGISALDRYLPLHRALQDYERRVNADVAHPLMRVLELPYPVLVGRLRAGVWSAQVPDRLTFEGRVGVPVGASPEQVRAEVEAALRAAEDATAAPFELAWTGGQFASGETDATHPFVAAVRAALAAETGFDAAPAGVPYGADMRLFSARGIPCVMAGPRGLALAHAVDERVRIDDLVAVARAIVRVVYQAFP